MKTRSIIRKYLLGFLLLVWFGSSAHGFYDPSVGRWVNRDPLTDEANNPFSLFGRIESLGLISANAFECHRADQNQPPVGTSKPASLRREIHNSFLNRFKR